jgi:hypothetical protein
MSAQTVTPPDQGQAKPAPTAASSAENDQVVVLSPFVVDADKDKGYVATSTLAGTRVRTDLKDIASSISVVTEQFLKDTGATNNKDLLVYTPSTEVAGLRGNFSGVGGTQVYQENTASQTTRVRGLDSADNTRDYFLTDIPWDSYNVGRVDLQRGPNSILFGVGSPAGIVNSSLNDAAFKTTYRYEVRVDEYGSLRNAIDLNQNLVPGLLSIRLAAVKDNELFEQKPAFENTNRQYVTLRFDPKLFGERSHTSLRVKYEQGTVDSNEPRSIPPIDAITPWFQTGTNQYGNPGFNKIILNQFNPAQVFNGVAYPGGKGGTLSNGLDLENQGRSFWPDIINYYEGTTYGANIAAGMTGPAYPSGTPIKTITAQPNTGLGLNSSGLTTNNGGSTLGAVNQPFLPMAIPELSSYLPNLGNTQYFAGKAVPGAVYYADTLIRDPSIFNFYKNLLDGPNKHEWKNWKAYNATLDQSFFNERLSFQVAVDHQTYTQGAEQWMTGQNYEINVDINATYADGTKNPNAGRPYAANGASQPGLNYTQTTVRDVFRFTPTGELRASDFLGDTTLAKIIGKHDLTGVYERNQVVQSFVNFAEYAVTNDYILDNSNNVSGIGPVTTGQLGSNRSFEWLVYLGPTLSNSSSAKNANLTNIPFAVAPPSHQTVTNFNSRWNKPTAPGAPGYVNPGAPFTYINPVNNPLNPGQVLDSAGHVVSTGTQSDNPANYVGWTQEAVSWMFASNPTDYPGLVEGGNRSKYVDNSRGVTWQGYMLGGDLVPTFGWRKDVIKNYATNAQTNPVSGFTSINYPDDPGSRTDVTGESKTWGVVYHLPTLLTSKLPWDSTISLFYGRGDNFKADASRLSLSGTPLPNADGTTTEYGVTFTTLHDKVTVKIDRYKTKVANATLAATQGNAIGGLSTNAYFLADGSIWGYGWATYLQQALASNGAGRNGANLTTYGDFSGQDGYSGINSWSTPAQQAASLNYDINGGPNLAATATTAPEYRNYAGGLAVVDAWVHAPFPSTFFSSYNLSPNIIPTLGAASGVLSDSYVAGYNAAGGPQIGGGSSFGNHQTTVTNLSKGTEVEVSFQPTKNLNLTANYTHTDATHENIDPTSIAFMSAMTKFFNGPAGQIRMWWDGPLAGDAIGADWNNSLVAPYAVTMNQLGHEAPEVSPWRLNLIATYTFDHGFAKGIFVGGAFREEAGRIIGYRYSSTIANTALTSDPNYADVIVLTQGGLDMNQPFYSKSEYHIDAWVGYSHKLAHNIDWRIQLNVKSVGEKDHLVSAGKNPDGSISLARIEQGMGWQLTNSFEF